LPAWRCCGGRPIRPTSRAEKIIRPDHDPRFENRTSGAVRQTKNHAIGFPVNARKTRNFFRADAGQASARKCFNFHKLLQMIAK
jgi:hypothetical protein